VFAGVTQEGDECLQRLEMTFAGILLSDAARMLFEFTYWCMKALDIESTKLHEGQIAVVLRTQLLAMPDDRMAYGFKSILKDFFDGVPADGAARMVKQLGVERLEVQGDAGAAANFIDVFVC
jgi:hypothetical protein